MSSKKTVGRPLVTLAIAAAALMPVAMARTSLLQGLRELMEDPSIRSRPAVHPLVDVVRSDLAAGSEAKVGHLRVRLRMTPDRPVAGEPVDVAWETDGPDGRPAVIEPVMHGVALHAYGVRGDLRGDLLHLHPLEREPGVWRDMVIFPSAGRWLLLSQTGKEGILHEFMTVVDVAGGTALPEATDGARDRRLVQFDVRLDAPKEVVAGHPVRLEFVVTERYPTTPRDVARDARWKHNLIFVRAGGEDPIIWNHHGDGSVDAVAVLGGMPVVRSFSPDHPFLYTAAFPRAGTWLVKFEYKGEEAPFIVDVR